MCSAPQLFKCKIFRQRIAPLPSMSRSPLPHLHKFQRLFQRIHPGLSSRRLILAPVAPEKPCRRYLHGDKEVASMRKISFPIMLPPPKPKQAFLLPRPPLHWLITFPAGAANFPSSCIFSGGMLYLLGKRGKQNLKRGHYEILDRLCGLGPSVRPCFFP